MPTRIFIAILALLLIGSDRADEGRRGNALYEEGAYAEAATAYRAALEGTDGETGAVPTGLWNNLGAALHQMGRHDEAAAAFERSLEAAETSAHRARALYNAGNNAEARGKTAAALDFYREALLADPEHADARFNYEYLQREMATREQQPSDAQSDAQDDADEQSPSEGENASPEQQRGDPPPEQQNDAAGQPRDERSADDPAADDPSERKAGEEGKSSESAEASEGHEGEDNTELSRAQAARILQALENQEKQLLRQIQKRPPRPRRIEKEW